MRIAVDLDGTICPIRQEHESYADLLPLPGAAERLRELRAAGHYIIIMTARHMGTCEANVGLVLKRVARVTLDWLDRHEIEYDEIYFGKPNAEVYLDDRAVRFTTWDQISEEGLIREARSK
jgi:capsule biosynthesis phosphatase